MLELVRFGGRCLEFDPVAILAACTLGDLEDWKGSLEDVGKLIVTVYYGLVKFLACCACTEVGQTFLNKAVGLGGVGQKRYCVALQPATPSHNHFQILCKCSPSPWHRHGENIEGEHDIWLSAPKDIHIHLLPISSSLHH